MNDHRHGEGGAANTPPFPPIDNGSPAGRPSSHDEEPPVPTPRLQDDTPLDFALTGDAEEHDDEVHDDFDDDEDDDVYDDDEPDWRADAYPTLDLESDEPDAPSSEADPEEGFAARARETMKRRAAESANRGFGQFADHLDEVADRIDRLANERLHGSGSRERAADAAHSTAGWIAGVSGYLRETDLDELRADLEDQVRRSPLRSVFIAVGAGWLLGRIIR